jgi:hypothetical protein
MYFFILTLLAFFFTYRSPGKHYPYQDPAKGASLSGTLGALQGATMTGTLAWTRRPEWP